MDCVAFADVIGAYRKRHAKKDLYAYVTDHLNEASLLCFHEFPASIYKKKINRESLSTTVDRLYITAVFLVAHFNCICIILDMNFSQLFIAPNRRTEFMHEK